VFQFLKVVDVAPGDIIQQDGSRDQWLVTDTSDHVQSGVFIKFEAAVERAGAGGAPRPKRAMGHTVNVAGNVIGGLQVGAQNSVQNVSVTQNAKLQRAIDEIRAAVAGSDDLDADDKDEVNSTLDRLCELAKREATEKTKTNINDKLTTVEKMINVSTKLAKIAGPAAVALREIFT
jgi:hypothetical protein